MNLFRRRPWHERDRGRPGWVKALRGFATAVVGVGLPLALIYGFITVSAPRPDEQPEAPRLPASRARDLPGDARLDGRWEVDRARSWVGYRVEEELPRLSGTFEAVGRTRTVTGSMVISGLTVEDVDVVANLRDLTSDRDWRDRVIRRRYLESNTYPQARFELDEPFALLERPEVAERVDVAVRGRLTIRDVTRRVTVRLQAAWDGERIAVVGTVPIHLPDYGVAPPRIGGFRFVADDGIVEVNLSFVPAE